MTRCGILASLWYCRNDTPVAVALKTFDLELFHGELYLLKSSMPNSLCAIEPDSFKRIRRDSQQRKNIIRY